MICGKCGKDLSKAVNIFGEEALHIHEAAHRREALRNKLQLVKTDVINRDWEEARDKLDELIKGLDF